MNLSRNDFTLARALYEDAHTNGDAIGPPCWDDESEQHKDIWRERAENLADPSGQNEEARPTTPRTVAAYNDDGERGRANLDFPTEGRC